jgi:transcription elongation factor GreA
MSTQYLTKEKYEKLRTELEELKTTKTREVAARLRQAKLLGDLSENADYQEAREQQRILDRRIQELGEVLRRSQIIEKQEGAHGLVQVGSKVHIKNEEITREYTIVGSRESKPADGLVSNESPIGRALLGKKVGEMVLFETPQGQMEYEILDVM